jgi:hypothetical protein
MSTNTNQDQEVDLGQIFGKIGSFFEEIRFKIFKAIQFIKKKIIILIALVVIGSVLGYLLDQNTKVYSHEIIATPNFGTVDYLYEKIDLLNSKINDKNINFLKTLKFKNPDKIKKIKIEPVVDIYTFVNNNTAIATSAQNTQNFELVKLLSEDGDIEKVIKDKLTSKNYSQHNITILTEEMSNKQDLIKPLLDYLNDNKYYNDIQKIFLDNIKNRIKQDQIIVNQIDILLNEFSSNSNSSRNDKLVYYNDNTQLNDLISQKSAIIGGIGFQKTQLLDLNKIINDKSVLMNKKYTKGINNKMKFILPFLLVFLFLFWKILSGYYQSLKNKYEKA